MIKQVMHVFVSRLLVPLFSIATLAAPLSGQEDVTWNGASTENSLWSNPDNWVGGELPDANDWLRMGAANNNNPRQTNENNLTGLVLDRIDLYDGGWDITGNAITLRDTYSGTANANAIIRQQRIWNSTDSVLGMDIHFEGTGFRMIRNDNNAVGNVGRTLEFSGQLSGDVDLSFSRAAPGVFRFLLSNPNNTFTGDVEFRNPGHTTIAFVTIADKGENSSLGAGDRFLLAGGSGTGTSLLSYEGTTHASSNRDFETTGMRQGNDVGFANNSPDNRNLTLTGSLSLAANTAAHLRGPVMVRLLGSSTGVSTLTGAINNYTNFPTDDEVTIGVEVDTAGTWILSGDNSYMGSTLVTAGTLLINGNQSAAPGAVTVDSGAILGGTGTIGGAVIVDGILSPGNSIGTLTVNDDVTWNSSAGNEWLFELGAAGADQGTPGTSDRLVIDGDFLKGSGDTFAFDFGGTGAVGWYLLASWSGTGSSFESSDFSALNVAGDLDTAFLLESDGLYLQVIPEPATVSLSAALLLVGILFWVRVRRARS